jgi:hypothetical protein
VPYRIVPSLYDEIQIIREIINELTSV